LAAWQGIVAPAGTPKDIVAKLSDELQKIQATTEFKEQLFRFGMESFPPQTPEQFAAMIAAEQPRWVKAIRNRARKSTDPTSRELSPTTAGSIRGAVVASLVIDVHTHCLTERGSIFCRSTEVRVTR
jgi:hypothetical protein